MVQPVAQKPKHVIQRFLEARQAGTGPKTMIIGHRGGYIGGPENSMNCFKAAQANNLDGIEFDVSQLAHAYLPTYLGHLLKNINEIVRI